MEETLQDPNTLGHFIDYGNATTIHPLGISALVLSCFAVFFVKRRFLFIPYLVMACFVSCAQRVVIFGVDFDFTRILIIAGLLRITIRSETNLSKLNYIDLLVIAWAAAKLICFTILWLQFGKFQWMAGQTLDSAGAYFLFRSAIKAWMISGC